MSEESSDGTNTENKNIVSLSSISIHSEEMEASTLDDHNSDLFNVDEDFAVDKKSNKKVKNKELKKEKVIDKLASNEKDLEEGIENDIIKDKESGIFKDLKGKHLKGKHLKGGKDAGKSKNISSAPTVERRVFDESDDLLSDYTSDTTFFDGEGSASPIGMIFAMIYLITAFLLSLL